MLSIEPFSTENEALASLDMQRITLADGTTTVMPKAELDKCLSGEPDEVAVVEEPVEVPVAPVEPATTDQDVVAPQI